MKNSFVNQELLVKNCQANQLTTKPFYTVKLTDFSKNTIELDLFRQHIEFDKKNFLPIPFTAAKRKVFTYKSIFLAFGLLFLVLGIFIYLKTFTLPYTYLLIGTFHIAKNLVCGFCGMASLASLLICYGLRTEYEIIGHLTRKAHRNLTQIYARKKIEHKIKSFINFGPAYQKSVVLSQIYRETLHKIQDLKDDTLHLFQRIMLAEDLNGGKKEHLYNQVVMEMDLKLEAILQDFKETHP